MYCTHCSCHVETSVNTWTFLCVHVVVKSVCVILQVKAEEVELQNTTPLSDNLIDFTDPTPVVSFSPQRVKNSYNDV